MKNFYKVISAILTLIWFSSSLNAQTQSTEQTWDLVKKQAAEANKLIFVDLYFTGCMPCAQMDKLVFPDPNVAKFLEDNFVVFKTDVLKEEIGKKLCLKYAVSGYPTYLFMSSDGKIIDIEGGYKPVDQFLTFLQNVKEKSQKGIYKKYSTQINTDDYPEFYRKAFEEKKLPPFDVVDAYLKKQPSLFAEIPFVIITGLRVGKEYDDFFIKNLDVFSEDYGKFTVGGHVLNILRHRKKEFEKTNDIEGFKQLMNKTQSIYTAEEWTRFEDLLLKDFGTTTPK